MLDPISKVILDEINKYAREERQRRGKLPYWLRCPACGKRVVKEELLKKGCYVCGWHGASDEAELAQIFINGEVEAEDNQDTYRTNCPRCKVRVVRRELVEKGCYICGWKPQQRIDHEERGANNGQRRHKQTRRGYEEE